MQGQFELDALLQEVTRQSATKMDLQASTGALSMLDAGDLGVVMSIAGHGDFPLRAYAHKQLADAVSIPRKYYERMQAAAPWMLAQNATHWLSTQNKRQTVRLLDGYVRAYLGSTYRVLDNCDLLDVILPELEYLTQDRGLQIESTGLTDEKLYIKAVIPQLCAEITPGDLVFGGVVISNSEVGAGALKVEPLVIRARTNSVLIAQDHKVMRRHVGSRITSDEDVSYYSQETLMVDGQAILLKVRDAIRNVLTTEKFLSIVDGLRDGAMELVRQPTLAVEEITRRYSLTDAAGHGILTHFYRGGSFTKFDLASAVAAHAQDAGDYEAATALQGIGYDVATMRGADWKAVANAKASRAA